MHTMTNQGEIPVVKSSEYMWYMQLKGMKDLGMDYIIMQNGVDFLNKRMAFSSPSLIEKGYKLGEGYGTKEPIDVVLKIAEKLSMKVYLGTIGTHGQYWSIMEAGGFEHTKEVVEIAKLYIKDMYECFDKYKSFEGYYFTDETCDEWLNAKQGVALYRSIYAPQAELIREIDPKRKTMISPAIWRSGSPSEGEENLYELIKPLEEGDRPIIDIVSAQDCLGREETLYVPNSAYKDYEEHTEAWAKGVRKAGAQFWSDAEVFEVIYFTKRYLDNVHSMEMQAKYTNGIVIFDYPHHFCEITKMNPNDRSGFNTSYVISQYAKRYCKHYKELDRIGME